VDGARLSRDGIDRVEFLIAPNKGIDPRPLRKIASGGELSRALLALKRVLAESGPAGLYIFDEVDSGVGGAIADKIGKAIGDVARHHQVLCITHLAPIAAFAGAHFVVTKQSAGGMAKSDVRRVDGKDRIAELARMLSGAKVTPAALKAATELVEAARPNGGSASASRSEPRASSSARGSG
jgi:DNA repair protein RecN (Recombination protein N)